MGTQETHLGRFHNAARYAEDKTCARAGCGTSMQDDGPGLYG